jgi:hypothetical protein
MDLMILDFIICLLCTLLVMCFAIGYMHSYFRRDKI